MPPTRLNIHSKVAVQMRLLEKQRRLNKRTDADWNSAEIRSFQNGDVQPSVQTNSEECSHRQQPTDILDLSVRTTTTHPPTIDEYSSSMSTLDLLAKTTFRSSSSDPYPRNMSNLDLLAMTSTYTCNTRNDADFSFISSLDLTSETSTCPSTSNADNTNMPNSDLYASANQSDNVADTSHITAENISATKTFDPPRSNESSAKLLDLDALQKTSTCSPLHDGFNGSTMSDLTMMTSPSGCPASRDAYSDSMYNLDLLAKTSVCPPIIDPGSASMSSFDGRPPALGATDVFVSQTSQSDFSSFVDNFKGDRILSTFSNEQPQSAMNTFPYLTHDANHFHDPWIFGDVPLDSCNRSNDFPPYSDFNNKSFNFSNEESPLNLHKDLLPTDKEASDTLQLSSPDINQNFLKSLSDLHVNFGITESSEENMSEDQYRNRHQSSGIIGLTDPSMDFPNSTHTPHVRHMTTERDRYSMVSRHPMCTEVNFQPVTVGCDKLGHVGLNGSVFASENTCSGTSSYTTKSFSMQAPESMNISTRMADPKCKTVGANITKGRLNSAKGSKGRCDHRVSDILARPNKPPPVNRNIATVEPFVSSNKMGFHPPNLLPSAIGQPLVAPFSSTLSVSTCGWKPDDSLQANNPIPVFPRFNPPPFGNRRNNDNPYMPIGVTNSQRQAMFRDRHARILPNLGTNHQSLQQNRLLQPHISTSEMVQAPFPLPVNAAGNTVFPFSILPSAPFAPLNSSASHLTPRGIMPVIWPKTNLLTTPLHIKTPALNPGQHDSNFTLRGGQHRPRTTINRPRNPRLQRKRQTGNIRHCAPIRNPVSSHAGYATDMVHMTDQNRARLHQNSSGIMTYYPESGNTPNLPNETRKQGKQARSATEHPTRLLSISQNFKKVQESLQYRTPDFIPMQRDDTINLCSSSQSTVSLDILSDSSWPNTTESLKLYSSETESCVSSSKLYSSETESCVSSSKLYSSETESCVSSSKLYSSETESCISSSTESSSTATAQTDNCSETSPVSDSASEISAFDSTLVPGAVPHRSLAQYLHQCPICAKGYCRKVDLDLHLLIHSFVLPRVENHVSIASKLHKCDSCGLAFCRQSDYQTHRSNSSSPCFEKSKDENTSDCQSRKRGRKEDGDLANGPDSQPPLKRKRGRPKKTEIDTKPDPEINEGSKEHTAGDLQSATSELRKCIEERRKSLSKVKNSNSDEKQAEIKRDGVPLVNNSETTIRPILSKRKGFRKMKHALVETEETGPRQCKENAKVAIMRSYQRTSALSVEEREGIVLSSKTRAIHDRHNKQALRTTKKEEKIYDDRKLVRNINDGHVGCGKTWKDTQKTFLLTSKLRLSKVVRKMFQDLKRFEKVGRALKQCKRPKGLLWLRVCRHWKRLNLRSSLYKRGMCETSEDDQTSETEKRAKFEKDWKIFSLDTSPLHKYDLRRN